MKFSLKRHVTYKVNTAYQKFVLFSLKTVENFDPENDENVVGTVEQSEGKSPPQALSLKCEE